MTTIQQNISRVHEEISKICQRIGRDPKDITLVAVTKFAPIEAIQEAVNFGVIDIAENKVQEGQQKYPSVKPSPSKGSLKRHLIGHLQTNKVKDALKVFDLIQSVDSLKLAQEIEKQTQKLNRSADILVQVNISEEEQKFGADQSEALRLIEEILQLKNIQIQGLMTMAPFTEDQQMIRDCFRGLRELKNQVKEKFQGHPNLQMKFLSMGMSGDYAIALEEGSNMLRIGSAIFKS